MKLYTNVSIIFLIWAAAVFFIFYLGFSSLPKTEIAQTNFFESLRNWDGGHYLGIAENGYLHSFQHAFFPLYPILIKLVGSLLNSTLMAGLLISFVATFLSLQLLYRLVLEDFDKVIAEKALLALLFFPTSFYFLTVYSEGLFFLLVIAAFFFLKKNNLLLATLIVALASATRIAGVALVLAFWVELMLTNRFSLRNWFVLLAPMGFLLYSFYLWQNTGDPFYFVAAESYWQREVTIPGLGFFETLKNLFVPNFISHHFDIFVNFLFAIFGIGFILRSARFLPPSYLVFSVISILIPLSNPMLTGIQRYLLPIFPIFITLALVKNRYSSLGYQIFGVMILAVFAVLFINGYWVT